MSSSHMRYSLDLVVDEDVKKPTKQTKTKTSSQNTFWFKNCKGLQTEVKKKSKKKKQSPFVHIFFFHFSLSSLYCDLRSFYPDHYHRRHSGSYRLFWCPSSLCRCVHVYRSCPGFDGSTYQTMGREG